MHLSGNLFSKIILLLFDTLPKFKLRKSSHHNIFANRGDGFFHGIAHSLRSIHYVVLLKECTLLEYLINSPLYNLSSNVFGFVCKIFSAHLDFKLPFFRFGVYFVCADKFDFWISGDLHRKILSKLVEFFSSGDEISLTVKFKNNPHASPRMNVFDNQTFCGCPSSLFSSTGDALLAQVLLSSLDIVVARGKGLLAIHHTSSSFIPKLLDSFGIHCHLWLLFSGLLLNLFFNFCFLGFGLCLHGSSLFLNLLSEIANLLFDSLPEVESLESTNLNVLSELADSFN
mmetsp:Transcript_126/g.309  ORF Transcript_126/g.309 Transcript_126/m.309 type:complete len:285 (+) Transcript_126:263-1117(+)